MYYNPQGGSRRKRSRTRRFRTPPLAHGIRRTTRMPKDEPPDDADDPVPAHVAEMLRELDLAAVCETLPAGLPVRESANTRARLRRLRRLLDDAFADVWEAVLAWMRYRFRSSRLAITREARA
jgi:hypothetical protein